MPPNEYVHTKYDGTFRLYDKEGQTVEKATARIMVLRAEGFSAISQYYIDGKFYVYVCWPSIGKEKKP